MERECYKKSRKLWVNSSLCYIFINQHKQLVDVNKVTVLPDLTAIKHTRHPRKAIVSYTRDRFANNATPTNVSSLLAFKTNVLMYLCYLLPFPLLFQKPDSRNQVNFRMLYECVFQKTSNVVQIGL